MQNLAEHYFNFDNHEEIGPELMRLKPGNDQKGC